MSLIEKHEQVDNANFKLLAALHQNKLLSHLNSETNLRHSTSRVPPDDLGHNSTNMFMGKIPTVFIPPDSHRPVSIPTYRSSQVGDVPGVPETVIKSSDMKLHAHACKTRCPNKALPLLDASSLAVWIHYQLIKDKDLPFNEGTHGASKFCENRQLNRQAESYGNKAPAVLATGICDPSARAHTATHAVYKCSGASDPGPRPGLASAQHAWYRCQARTFGNLQQGPGLLKPCSSITALLYSTGREKQDVSPNIVFTVSRRGKLQKRLPASTTGLLSTFLLSPWAHRFSFICHQPARQAGLLLQGHALARNQLQHRCCSALSITKYTNFEQKMIQALQLMRFGPGPPASRGISRSCNTLQSRHSSSPGARDIEHRGTKQCSKARSNQLAAMWGQIIHAVVCAASTGTSRVDSSPKAKACDEPEREKKTSSLKPCHRAKTYEHIADLTCSRHGTHVPFSSCCPSCPWTGGGETGCPVEQEVSLEGLQLAEAGRPPTAGTLKAARNSEHSQVSGAASLSISGRVYPAQQQGDEPGAFQVTPLLTSSAGPGAGSSAGTQPLPKLPVVSSTAQPRPGHCPGDQSSRVCPQQPLWTRPSHSGEKPFNHTIVLALRAKAQAVALLLA
ncbi:hypothetical protein Anapl_05312 [Anas platyrhynchos]|uniref:Uncharacterized protein n=1 Tax=Anas platyrhynchos TaxID=8839 RepID=R0M4Y5_ANAPL|nr:hypothetical protein Anapl_05312 [Anas platyrhynchos]